MEKSKNVEKGPQLCNDKSNGKEKKKKKKKKTRVRLYFMVIPHIKFQDPISNHTKR